MLKEQKEFVAKVESGEASFDEIKEDLQRRCAEIPIQTWFERFPGMQAQIEEDNESLLLPLSYTHRDRVGEMRTTMGPDMVETFLSRNGRLIQKLVHHQDDGWDGKLAFPDEFLGEAEERIYRRAYSKADWILDTLSEDARKSGFVSWRQ